LTKNKFLGGKAHIFALGTAALLVGLTFASQNYTAFATNPENADNVSVPSVSNGPAVQNMLQGNSVIIDNASVSAIYGENNSLTATYSNLPVSLAGNKVIAVLVDEYVAPGTAYMSQFLDENGMVTFQNIDPAVKLPQIHLYKQDPADPDYTLRAENFISKNMFLMPYVKPLTNNGGYANENALNAYGNNSERIDMILTSQGKAKLETTTVPNLYSLQIPSNYFSTINKDWSGIQPSSLFGIVLAEDPYGNVTKQFSVVSTNYNVNEFCRFEFMLPEGTTNFQFHIYKDSLVRENFLLKYMTTINKANALQYSL